MFNFSGAFAGLLALQQHILADMFWSWAAERLEARALSGTVGAQHRRAAAPLL